MLDWDRFKTLPGADTEKFEKLCRGVVRRNFGSLGPLHELKNQPGVEFYIKLNNDHPRLAKRNDTVGWQNKWFGYKANGELTNTAKQQIIHSLDKTKEHVSHINHWFLWTHQTLAKCDQEWFYDLQSNYGFTLHLWNQHDLDELLSGPALDLRNSYFGELALTNEMLLEQHEKSIAPIKTRWLHEVHQRMDAELQVRKVLGEKEAWDTFKNIADDLDEVSETIESSINKPEYSRWSDELKVFHAHCVNLLEHCEIFNKDISGDDIQDVMATIGEVDSRPKLEIQRTLIQLRSGNLPLSLTITNALAYIKDIKNLFRSAVELLSQQFIAIMADAGGGKTQLAVELTVQTPDRPAGIFILGRSLKKDMTLDDIAHRFTFYQKQVNNFEALISAVNSAGERSSRRLPIVIDGLNEAQDPREWKHLFESILPVLKKYPNVVLVCTLRTSEKGYENYYRPNRRQRYDGREGSAQQSLPESAFEILSEGYGEALTHKAIADYFRFYKIKADPFTAPLNFFSHPLNLKIFCEVTNRKAENEIRVPHFPSSIYSLFREQIDHTANSIASLTNLKQRYLVDDVKKAIYFLGECIWENNTRSIAEDVFRDKAKLPLNDWDSDMVNLLAQEGIIFRDEGSKKFSYELTPVYDRLGGFIVAEYLLGKNSGESLSEWVTHTDVIEKIFGEVSDQHPLSQDILHALVVLIPKTINREQLWKVLPEDYQSVALALTPLIDKNDICTETLDNYKSLITHEGLSTRDIEQLLTLKYAVEHPLNAELFNEILFNLSVSDRDLSWTEYIRSQSSEIISALKDHLINIKSGAKFSPETIRLRMIFFSWHLTSTVIELRDCATELLYHVGQQDPGLMFELTLEQLSVNDPYVSERLLASSYALATVLVNLPGYGDVVINYGEKLYNKMFVINASNATPHLLAREYASCTLKLIAFHYPSSTQNLDRSLFLRPFPEMPRRVWGCIKKDEEEYSRYNSPFRMDFENYTIGRLVKDRGNYDYSHEGYKVARCNILWRVNELGWSHDLFEKVEESIESDRHHFSRSRRSRIERYGKKYSWIAYYELAGQLSDDSRLESYDEARFTTDIDPFFPDQVKTSELGTHEFLSDESMATKDWILETEIPDLSRILEIKVDDHDWVLLYGFNSEESKKLDRNFYCSLDTAFVSEHCMNQLKQYMAEKRKIEWPEKYSSYSVYSGELYCEALNDVSGDSEVRVEIGYKTQTYEQPEVRFNDEIYIKGGTFEREVPIVDNLKILSTTFNYYWENPGSSKESTNRLALAPWLVKELELRFNPSEFIYLDKSGDMAVLNINLKGDAFSNYRDLLYLRKDLFDKLNKKLEIMPIKHIAGEKRYAKTENLGGEDSYRRFESIVP
ncbi:hypothetical protein O0V09_14865 [Dasania sp. GY-19]|uniref:NACHT domain-containing protein n=1 Tax=Dasania phycosphaerae TaxID=2950436 RepID=A0A9J6RPK7_9GAMM|nr:hypothetical protein [Dasania phycosphaerae]MCZ0866491.1 hypothetical protein [Dasania phycosphaerae]|tara:strand:- start:5311 stop:9411 length:4101 start_codon:yes stop_codon:yes gene_type:complete